MGSNPVTHVKKLRIIRSFFYAIIYLLLMYLFWLKELMKKRGCNILLLIFTLAYCIVLTGCEKQICSYCGEEKECDEYDILGTKRYICGDCLGDMNMSLSGNVIIDYESSLVDPALYLPGGSVSEDEAFVAGNLGSVSDNSQITSEDILSIPDMAETTSSDNLRSESAVDSGSSDSRLDKDAIVGAVASMLSGYNYYIQPDEDNKDVYHIYFGSEDAKVVASFSTTSSGNTSVIVSMLEGALDDDFSNVCINMNLAFLGSTEYEQDGFNIYNNAKNYGNYSSGGCKFYYLDGLVPADNDGVVATYEIKYE